MHLFDNPGSKNSRVNIALIFTNIDTIFMTIEAILAQECLIPSNTDCFIY